MTGGAVDHRGNSATIHAHILDSQMSELSFIIPKYSSKTLSHTQLFQLLTMAYVLFMSPAPPQHVCHMLHLTALTQLVEVCLQAVWTRDGTHQTSLLEGAPLVDQAALASDVVLHREEQHSIHTWLMLTSFDLSLSTLVSQS